MSAYLQSVTTAVDFIESHLQEEINVADMATAASYSLYHFCRIFNQTVHHSPYDYLMRRRLTCAATDLVTGEERITDIAFAYQFGSPESFSRAFRRMFGQLPTQWRKQGVRDERVLMRRMTPAHLAQRNQPNFRLPTPATLVTWSSLTLVGLMTVAHDDTAVDALRHHLPTPPTHIIYHYPHEWAERGKLVLAGTARTTNVEANVDLPFVSQTVPPGVFACFAQPETPQKRQLLSDYIYQTWLPQSTYELAFPFEVEHNKQVFIPLSGPA